MGLQVPQLVASYQANFINGALFFMMCAIASGASPVRCLPTKCAPVMQAKFGSQHSVASTCMHACLCKAEGLFGSEC